MLKRFIENNIGLIYFLIVVISSFFFRDITDTVTGYLGLVIALAFIGLMIYGLSRQFYNKVKGNNKSSKH